MVLIKVYLPFLYSSMKIFFAKIRLIFDIEKWLWKSEFCYIRPSLPNQAKYLEPFMAVFIDLWPCLLTTKLRYAQLFKWGHSSYLVRRMVHMALWWIIDDKKIFRTDDSEKYLWSFRGEQKEGRGQKANFSWQQKRTCPPSHVKTYPTLE